MKKVYLTVVLMLTGLCGISINTHAQDVDAAVVSVPFEFVAGGATLPEGQYRVSRINTGGNRLLAISGYNKGSAFLLPLTFDGGAAANGQPTLSFEHIGDKYFLTGIKTWGGVYTMSASREMVMLGKANSPNPSPSSASGSQ